MHLVDTFYLVKPFIPRRMQLAIRSAVIRHKRSRYADRWPIDPAAGETPPGWPGWPEGKRFAVVLTHDVDTAKGHAGSRQLMELEKQMGFRSSFNFVPERYAVSETLRNELTSNGFEVGVHGLRHDGNLFASREKFLDEAVQINWYMKEWNAVGFRAPCMFHNLEWIADLDIEYDASTFDTDPFEPQPDGLRTIFPLMVNNGPHTKEYVELPYTLSQDFTLFILMREQTTDIWKKKVDWIVRQGGMVLVNTHPDYMCFNPEKPGLEEYPAQLYADLLTYLHTAYEGQYWHALPKDVAKFLRGQIHSSSS